MIFILKKNVQNCSLFEFIDEKSGKQIRNFLKRKFSSHGNPKNCLLIVKN